MKSALATVFFSTTLFFFATLGGLATESPEKNLKIFFEANDFYQRGEYNNALKAYEALLPENSGGPVYFNMGNCYFRLNQLGKAIVYYRKALHRDPRNREIQFNLRYVREKTRDEIENKKGTGVLGILFSGAEEWTWRENVAGTAGIYALLMVVGTVRLFRKFDNQGLCLAVLGTLLFLSVASAGFKLYQDRFVREGAVVHPEVSVHSAANTASVVLFKLHDGAEFLALAQQGEWVQIELRDGKKGWVPRHFTEFI